MKSKTKIVWLAFVLISFFVVGAVGDQKAGWKGQVEEEEGVKVIKNPQNPLYGEIELELELDLSIGGDVADENYNFILISDVEVDDEGNIYVPEGNCMWMTLEKFIFSVRTIPTRSLSMQTFFSDPIW